MEEIKTADKIKVQRFLKKMTQKELAQKAGLSEITIRKYEAGDKVSKKEQILMLSHALDIDVSALIDDELIKQNYNTVGDVLEALFSLNDSVGITIQGERDKLGNLDADTISLKINNSIVNQFIRFWENFASHDYDIAFSINQLRSDNTSSGLEIDELKNLVDSSVYRKNIELETKEDSKNRTESSLIALGDSLPLENEQECQNVFESIESKLDPTEITKIRIQRRKSASK